MILFAILLVFSCFKVGANPIPRIVNSPSAAALASQSLIQEVYCIEQGGRVHVYKDSHPENLPRPSLVIANGGGGQAGMIEHLATQFLLNIKHSVPPETCIGWWASNTHGSHFAVQEGTADLAVVYDVNRIKDAVAAKEIEPTPEHIWMDRFAFVGPKEAPALILPTDSAENAALSIMESNNAYFLTRVDKSTANLREANLFARLIASKRLFYGLDTLTDEQVLQLSIYQGWKSMPKELQDISKVSFDAAEIHRLEAQIARDQTKPHYQLYQRVVRPDFYRPINLLPKEATSTASRLGWYTLSDNGIFNSLPQEERANLALLLDGKEQLVKEDAFFLNPAFVIKSTRAASNQLADTFLTYLKRDEVKKFVVPSFMGREAGAAASTVDDLEINPKAVIPSRPSMDSRMESASIASLYESPYEKYQNEINKLLLQRTLSGSAPITDARVQRLKMMRTGLTVSPQSSATGSLSSSPPAENAVASSKFEVGNSKARLSSNVISKVAQMFEKTIVRR